MSQLRPISKTLARLLLFYRILFPFFATIILPRLIFRMRRRGGYKEDFAQRLGYFSSDFKTRCSGIRWNWIHSISVGETMIALKLAHALRAAQPDIHIALSVTTSTGYAVAKESASEWLLPLYNPLDLRSCVQRTLNVLRPERLLFIEGELWPNLMAESYQRGIPIALVNARLSPRSARRFVKFKKWVGPLLDLLEWISVPDAAEVPVWRSIGVETPKLHLTGSIKFDQSDSGRTNRADSLKNVLLHLGIPLDAPLLLGGSTHAGEELLLVGLLREWRKSIPHLRLILVPRHIERTQEILKELTPSGFKIEQRSRVTAHSSAIVFPTSPPDILLVDTTGELKDWYSLATVIFIGKSFTGGGGQNPVEAALACKPVVFGPLMDNFQVAAQQLVQSGGAIQVRDADHLQTAIRELFDDPELRGRLSKNAIRVMEHHQGATARTSRFVLKTPHPFR